MRPREIKWLIAIVFIGVLSGIMIKSWQYWQRNHFQCSGEMRLINAGYQGDISLRYVFDSSRGLAMVRGKLRRRRALRLPLIRTSGLALPATASTTSCVRKPSQPASARPSRKSM